MSVVVKRSVTIEGHKTSVTLEDEFWDALRVIAQRDKTTMYMACCGAYVCF